MCTGRFPEPINWAPRTASVKWVIYLSHREVREGPHLASGGASLESGTFPKAKPFTTGLHSLGWQKDTRAGILNTGPLKCPAPLPDTKTPLPLCCSCCASIIRMSSKSLPLRSLLLSPQPATGTWTLLWLKSIDSS